MKQLAFQVVVVGAGPAGLAAATRAAQGGATVGIIDDNPAPGGQIWRGGQAQAPSASARQWLAAADLPAIQTLGGARVIAALGPQTLLVETATEAMAIGFEQLVLATGARERFLPFPGWTLPGVLGAGGLQALVKGGLPIAGKRVVVAGSGPLLLAVAAYLTGKGARVTLVAEQTPWPHLLGFGLHLLADPAKLRQATQLGWNLRGTPFKPGCWVTEAHGDQRLTAVTLRCGQRVWREDCEYLACGFGLVPNTELALALGCQLANGTVWVDSLQRTSAAAIFCAGEATGIGGLELALLEGQIAGLVASGQTAAAVELGAERDRARRLVSVLERTFALRPELKTLAAAQTILCRCEDVAYGEVRRHADWRSAKLHSRCGMGPCQGRICGAATAFLFGWTQDSVRPPITVARLGSLAQPFEPPQQQGAIHHED